MALARSSQWQQFVEVVEPGDTVIVDSLDKTKVYSAGYHINIRNADNSLSKTLKVDVNRSEGSVKENIYSLLGDSLNVYVNTNVSVTDFELIIENNELFPVTVTIQRSVL